MLDQCQIRKMREADLEMVLEWRNHSDVRRFMFTQHEISLAEHTQWFSKAEQDGSRRLLIVEELGSPIGYVQFSNVVTGGIADWGFYVRPNAEKGTGRKLGALALGYAFDALKLHKVCGQAIAKNQASIRFHESLGFKREAELRDQMCISNEYHNLICFGLLANEWQAEKQGKKL
jgi:UDP-4-amino-4,6-dideoxy-N-acetyl-beta-L-altrosamine N-acetyltransferase